MIDAEDTVIGMLLSDRNNLERVIDSGLSPAMFDNERNATLFAAMVIAEKECRRVTVATLSLAFPHLTADLRRLEESAPVAQNIGYYAAEVMAASNHRKLTRDLSALATRMTTRKPFEDVDHYAAQIATMLAEDVTPDADGPVPMIKVVDRVLAKIEDAMAGSALPAIPTGFRVLNKALSGGWRAGMLYIPAARPGRGKTSFAVNAMDAASAAGHHVAFFTSEMPLVQIGQKHVSRFSQVRGTRLDRGDLSEEEVNRLGHAVQELHKRPIWIDDSSRGNVNTIVSRCRRLKRRGRLDLVFIDYLQLLKAPGFRSRIEMLTDITATLKALAMELKIAVVCMSTINREAEKFGEPGIHHLKDSGSIEQDADAVLLIHSDKDDRTEINVAKNRHGPEVRFFIDVDFATSTMRDGDNRDPQEISHV